MAKPKTYTPILEGAYQVIGLQPGLVGTKIGEVNLALISLETAERLISINFPYLRKTPKGKTTRHNRRNELGQFKVLKDKLQETQTEKSK